MQVEIVSHIFSVGDWSSRHHYADIKRIEPITYRECGVNLTYFAIYFESKYPIGGALARTGLTIENGIVKGVSAFIPDC